MGQVQVLRQQMVKLQIEGRGVEDEDVLRTMRTVPRHEFIPREFTDQAYEDHPLPIGYGQTISQPYIVAVMTELLHLSRDSRVMSIQWRPLIRSARRPGIAWLAWVTRA